MVNQDSQWSGGSKNIQSIIWIFFGIAFLVAGFVVFKMTTVPSSYIKTAGTVTSVRLQITASGQRTRYIPTIAFSTNSGQSYSFTAHILGLAPTTYTQGEMVTVAYDPQNPNRTKVVDKNNQIYHKISIATMVGGVLMLTVGIVLRRV